MELKSQFHLHELTRHKFLGYLEHLSIEQLTDIPYGFKNNIWWNIVHTVVTQQLLCYYLSGNDFLVDNYWIENYKKGTAPNSEDCITASEINDIKKLLVYTQQQLQSDYEAGKFTQYNTYPTSYGFTIDNIKDAIQFNNVHEVMHLGTIIAIKKLV